MLEEEPKKIGLRLSNSRLKEIAARQIMTTKHVEHIPATMYANDAFIDPHKRNKHECKILKLKLKIRNLLSLLHHHY